MSRFEMLEAMNEDEGAGDTKCERCKKTAPFHIYRDGWYYCQITSSETVLALSDRSPNLGELARQVQANLEMFKREDKQDGAQSGNQGSRYPRRESS